MSEYRQMVAFHAGTPEEKHVTFNSRAPEKLQAEAAEAIGRVYLKLGLPCAVGAVFLNLYYTVPLLCDLFPSDTYPGVFSQAFWTVAGGCAVCFKVPAFSAYWSTSARGETAKAAMAGFACVLTALFSFGCTWIGLAGDLASANAPMLERALAAAGALPLAILIEVIATAGIEISTSGAKAFEASYPLPPEPAPVEISPFGPPPPTPLEVAFAQWAHERLAIDTTGRTATGAAFDDFERWVQFKYQGNIQGISRSKFGVELANYAANLGIAPGGNSGRRAYSGLALRGPATASSPAALPSRPPLLQLPHIAK